MLVAVLLLALLFNGCTGSFSPYSVERPYPGAIEVIKSGNADEALREIEATAYAYDTNKDWMNAHRAYLTAALLAEALGNYQKMLTYARKSYDLAEQTYGRRGLQTPALGFASNLLAKAHLAVNDFESVFPLLLNILPRRIPQIRKQAQHYADLHGTLGDAYQRKGDLESARRHHEEAFKVQERVWGEENAAKRLKKRKSRLVRSPVQDRYLRHLTALVRDHVALGEYQRAVDHGEKLLKLAKDLGYRQWEGEGYRLLGDVALKQGNYNGAFSYYQQVVAMGEGSVNPSVLLWSHVGLGRAHLSENKPDLAANDFERAMEIVETLRTFLESEDTRSSFFEDKVQIYSETALVQLELGRIAEAFHTTERARARAFLDLLGTRASLSKNRELAAAEMTFSRKVAELRLLIAEDDEEEEVQSRQEEIQALQRAYKEFLAKVGRESGEQASMVTVQPLNLKQVQEVLEPDQTLLEYFVTADRTYLWIVSRERLQVVTIAVSRKELSAKLNSLRRAIAQIDPLAKYREVAGELYRLLILPGVPFIRGKEIIIVPHDVLHYLPFQALYSPEGKYLIEDYALHYLSSASLLRFTKEKSRAMGEKVLALGNPDLGDPKMALQFAGIEAKEIKNLYPQSSIYLEKEATEEKAKSLSGQNDIIHFASHAELNENDPLSSAVLLAKSDKEDGRLEVREIFGMDLKASLVVLSACETGLGKLSSGDELVGLTRAFIYAGTPSVVASLWNVEDSSTAALMASFYKNLKTMSKVEALRQAQLNLIRGNVNSDLLARRGIGGVGKLGETPSVQLPAPSSDPHAPSSVSTSHPYFWAPFILVGDGK